MENYASLIQHAFYGLNQTVRRLEAELQENEASLSKFVTKDHSQVAMALTRVMQSQKRSSQIIISMQGALAHHMRATLRHIMDHRKTLMALERRIDRYRNESRDYHDNLLEAMGHVNRSVMWMMAESVRMQQLETRVTHHDSETGELQWGLAQLANKVSNISAMIVQAASNYNGTLDPTLSFARMLEDQGYHVGYGIADCPDCRSLSGLPVPGPRILTGYRCSSDFVIRITDGDAPAGPPAVVRPRTLILPKRERKGSPG